MTPMHKPDAVSGLLPMRSIPAGFFRMGKGHTRYVNYLKSFYDHVHGNCWPIQTVSMPSFFISQYGTKSIIPEEP